MRGAAPSATTKLARRRGNSSRSTSTRAATFSALCAGVPTTGRTMRSSSSIAGRSCTRWARATRSGSCSNGGMKACCASTRRLATVRRRARRIHIRPVSRSLRGIYGRRWRSLLNVAATTQPTNAFLLTGDEKYKRWVVADRDARGCDAGVQRASVGERHTRRNHQCGGCAGADRPPWARCGRTSASHHAALRECADGATSWQRQPPAATARSGTRPGPPVPLP